MSLHALLRFLPILLFACGLALWETEPLEGKTKDGKDKQEQTADPEKQEEKGEPTLQRIPSGSFESIRNRVSNIDFFSTNYGILFLDVANGNASGIYPRGSGKAYLFGGGIWFGGQKFLPEDPSDQNSPLRLKSMSVISYNPNSGSSWMVPGEVTQPYESSSLDESPEAVNKYRIYFSTDYDPFTGEPFDQVDIRNGGPNWPIWDTDPDEDFLVDRYLGRYVSDVQQRDRTTFSKGPAIVSGEDIVSIFKDTDVTQYEIGKERARREGYPLGLEFDQRIYSWGFGAYQNFIFIRYSIVNKSPDTIYNCYVAPALDPDIGFAGNDRTRTVIPNPVEDSLDLGAQWSDLSNADRGFGYMGVDFLESPAVFGVGHPEEGFIRNDQKFYTNDEQLGLHALRNWIIDIDPATPQERYQFMAEPKRDGDTGPGDKRFLQSTGPFNMRPGDTARVVVGILIAPAKSNTPDGTWEDMDSLITLDLFAQRVYDENFLAPRPPYPANVDWRPLDNGVELFWDEESERSLDVVERGLDFAGYIIQRARKSAGRDFVQYDSVVGFNVGYKTIAQFSMPPFPSNLTRAIAAINQNLRVLGPWWRLPMLTEFSDGDTNQGPFEIPFPFDTISRNCVDTIFFEGGGIEFDTTDRYCGRDTIWWFSFNAFDDENNDSTLYNEINSYWWAGPEFEDRFSNKAIRDIVRDAITEIMDSVTDGRTFIDVGDDNGDGRVDASSVDLPANEKLINSIDYFYRVLAFDAGSTEGNTPPKTNSGIAGINEVRATPEAPSAGLPVTPEIISQYGLGGISNFNILVLDQERLGQLFGNDTLEFEFRPYRLWDYDPNRDTANNRFFGPNWYTNEVIVRSRSLGELNRFAIPLLRGDIARRVFSDRAFVESRGSNRQYFNLDSTFTSRFVYFSRDTVIKRPGEPDKDTTVVDSIYVDRRHIMATYRNTFVTEPGRLLLGTNGVTKSTLGISFDWAGQQFGDSLRFGRYISDPVLLPHRDSSILGHIIQIPSIDGADTTYRPEYRDDFNPFELIDGPGEGTPNPTLIDGAVAYGNDQNSLVLNRSIPSIGQPLLEVEFLPGGTETLVWTKDNKEYRVENVPYLIPVVRNLNSYSYEVFSGDGSSTDQDVNYDYEFPADGDIALRLNTAGTPILDNDDAFIRLVDLGEFALATYAWGNIANMTVKERRTVINFRGRDRSQLPTISPASKPIGTPNRYYVGEHIVSIDDTESVDVRFTHRLVCNGAITLIDFAGMGAVTASITSDTGRRKQIVPDSRPSVDFQAGDKFRVHFAGGALGLPQPDAKVVVAIPDPTPGPGEFTDDLLDAVRVVPNPYLVDHLGQSTTSEKVIYITRLPEKCTIEIYTAGGELVQTIEHDASKNVDGRIAVNAWDLVSRGNRQVQTQLFVARIVTPDGAETVKKFSVVVGGFRFLTR